MNLRETPVQLVVVPIQDRLPDEELIIVSPAQILQSLHVRCEPLEADTIVISEGQCITYKAIRYIYGSLTLGLGVMTRG